MKRYWTIAALGLAAMGATALAQTHNQPSVGQPSVGQPYAGQHQRAVTSLSAEELHGFLAGRGMGLAKAAELNGYPGPMHLLELQHELKLTAEQRRSVDLAFQRMKANATDLGRKYVEAELAVDAAFRSGKVDAATIAARVAEANRLLGEVRLSHLAAHLEVTPLLTPEQRTRYAELRDYGAGDGTHGKHRH